MRTTRRGSAAPRGRGRGISASPTLVSCHFVCVQCEGIFLNAEEEDEYVDYTEGFSSTEGEGERHVTFPDCPRGLPAYRQRGDTETSTGEHYRSTVEFKITTK
jgi:hypothetical protein